MLRVGIAGALGRLGRVAAAAVESAQDLELVAGFVRDAAHETAKPDRDGWVRCTLPIESVTHGAHELLRLREEVEVLGPPELRKAMIDALASLMRHHRNTQ